MEKENDSNSNNISDIGLLRCDMYSSLYMDEVVGLTAYITLTIVLLIGYFICAELDARFP